MFLPEGPKLAALPSLQLTISGRSTQGKDAPGVASPPIGKANEEHLDNVEFQVAKILISYLQVVSVIRDVDAPLPGPVQRMFQV